jgi:uncharacterized membrane protein YfcA
MELAIILVAMAVGAFIKGVTGSGLPQIAIPVMASFIGVEPAVVIMAIPGVATNTWLLLTHRRHRFETRDLPSLLVMGIAGAVVGTWLLKSLDNSVLSLVLAAVVVLYVVVFLFRPQLSVPPAVTRFTSPGVGAMAGVLQGSTGVSGPVLMTYLHSFRLGKEAYVFSLTLLFQVYAVVQTAMLVALGLFTQTRLIYSLLSLIPIMVLLALGARVAKRLSRRTFDYVVLALMAGTALKLAYDGLAA